MRKVFALTMMLLAFLSIAAAQTPNTPVVHLQKTNRASVHAAQASIKLPASPPSTAEPLLFYGGDTNTDDPNDDGFANGNTLLVPNTAVYGAITVPSGGKVVATGILFNQIATQSGDIFDPATATFDIRSGVSEGNGGKDILNGSGPQSVVPTGRQPFGYTEYATSVSFTKQLTPASGTTYFVNLSSQCTDSGNSVCNGLQYFADNTTQQTNGIDPNLQPSYSSFFNSAYFGYDWANVCDLVGGQSPLCEWQSFGIYGVNKGTGVIFYSGDFNPSNTLANGLLNQNVSGNDGEVWVPFWVAKQITISYIFINELFSTIPPAAAPATWTIVNGFSDGNPGKIQCQGSGTAYSSPTGRTFTFDGTTYTELQWTESSRQNLAFSEVRFLKTAATSNPVR